VFRNQRLSQSAATVIAIANMSVHRSFGGTWGAIARLVQLGG